MKRDIILSALLIIAVLLGITLFEQYILNGKSPLQAVTADKQSTTQGSSSLTTTLISYCFIALVAFLINARWKEHVDRLTAMETKQSEVLQDIEKTARERIESRVTSTEKRAQIMQERVANILEQHPWIKGITDSEFIPDSCSCRIVLNNSLTLFKNKRATLAHEYLFSWVDQSGWVDHSSKKKRFLQGSPSDFRDLADFCLLALSDEYLAGLLLAQAYEEYKQDRHARSSYVKAYARLGLYSNISKVTVAFRKIIYPRWYVHLIQHFLGRSRHTSEPGYEDFAAQAILESAAGNSGFAAKGFADSKSISQSQFSATILKINEFESRAMLGELTESDSDTATAWYASTGNVRIDVEQYWALKAFGRNQQAMELMKSMQDAYLHVHGLADSGTK